MKVGILTFHRAENFGAVLQVYALQTFLGNHGFDAVVIDYRCRTIEVNYHIFNPSILWSRKNIFFSLKQYFSRFLDVKERWLRKKKFRDFRESYLRLTEPVFDMTDLGFDAYITGSDQVWNFHLTGGFDNAYFLNFPMKTSGKRIAYAASSDNDPCDLMSTYRERISNALTNFDAISVRELFLKEKLTSFIKKDIQVCLDPTFLLEAKDYLKVAIKPQESNYVLIYHMTNSVEASLLAKRIAKTFSCEIIETFGGYNKSIDSHFTTKYCLSPLELLGYIAYARCIVTTSFHGLALSLKLHKDVWVMNKGDNLRQRGLLKLLDIENRLVDSVDNVDIEKSMNYNKIDEVLNAAIDYSKTFILSSLK